MIGRQGLRIGLRALRSGQLEWSLGRFPKGRAPARVECIDDDVQTPLPGRSAIGKPFERLSDPPGGPLELMLLAEKPPIDDLLNTRPDRVGD